jgi:hypothetical protein
VDEIGIGQDTIMNSTLNQHLATAILGIDTLWGGDVMSASGTGRFIADSWFSDESLPRAYTAPEAAPLRAGAVDSETIDAYLAAVDIPEALDALKAVDDEYVAGLHLCLQVMWDLAMERQGRVPPVSYQRCVEASTGAPPEPSNPAAKLDRVAELLGCAPADLLGAVDAWRARHRAAMSDVRHLGAEAIAEFDRLTAANVVPHLPPEFRDVPRANIEFLAIQDAWFSGSMNYLGRARRSDGNPEYEATYEINASLEISMPEFLQLVSHEVVPGHVTTFAYLQNLYWRGVAGFEASVLTMNTRAATLFEGIANNAILMAYGVTEIGQLPDRDLQIGVLLALLQDDAKNQASYLTWGEGVGQDIVAQTLRRDFLVSTERAGKLSGAWGRHPLLGRMYLPCYRAGTLKVAELRRRYPAERVLPALYGAKGLVDITTVEGHA